MIDFNALMNEAIKAAIATAVEQATADQNDLIRTLMEEVRDLGQQVVNLTDQLASASDDSRIERIATDAIDNFMRNNPYDDVLGTDDFESAVRSVIRDCL